MTTKTDASEQTELTPVDETPTAVAEYTGPSGFAGEPDASDKIIPVCSLVQPMSQDKGEAGRYSFPSGESLIGLDAVVLQIGFTRALWLPIEEQPTGPLCNSNDRLLGRTSDAARVTGSSALGSEEEMYLPCAECRYKPTAKSFEKIDGLWCPFSYTLLMYERHLGLPFLYFIKGTATSVIKKAIVSPALYHRDDTGRDEPWLKPYFWTIKLIEQPGRKYYSPVIEAGEDFTDEEVERYAAMCGALSSQAAEQEEVT